MAKKPPLKIDDPVFGPLLWDALSDAWEAGISVAYFSDFGRDLLSDRDDGDEEEEQDDDESVDATEDDAATDPATAVGAADPGDMILKAASSSTGFVDLMMQLGGLGKEKPADVSAEHRTMFEQAFAGMRERAEAADHPPVDYDKVRRRGRFVLSVVAVDKKQPPTGAQRAAWATLTGSGGPAVFGAVMARLLETYRRQRPARLKWAAALDPDASLDHLPDVKTTADLARIVRPTRFRVHRAGEVGIEFDAAWDRGGIGVLLRGTDVVAVGTEKVGRDPPRAAKPGDRNIDHPVFGPLRRAGRDEWVGTAPAGAFGDWFELAEARSTQQRYGNPASPWAPPWDLVEGRVDLNVFAEEKSDGTPAEPDAATVDAYAAFRADEPATADAVLAAVFKYYRRIYAEYDEEDGDLPPAKSPADLRERMTLQSITVLPPPRPRTRAKPKTAKAAAPPKPAKPPKPAAVVLNLSVLFDEEHGMSVLWRGGKVEQITPMGEVDV